MRPINGQFRVLRDLNPRFLSYTLDPRHVQRRYVHACKYYGSQINGLLIEMIIISLKYVPKIVNAIWKFLHKTQTINLKEVNKKIVLLNYGSLLVLNSKIVF